VLHSELLRIINSGQAWAFVGSGASADAGAPSWKGIVDLALAQLPSRVQTTLLADAFFSGRYAAREYQRCLSVLEEELGRSALVGLVTAELSEVRPGRIHDLLADLPFAGYITTNYDHGLESALLAAGHLGWVAVGNKGDEPRAVSGGADHIVWHVHGGVELSDAQSRLVLTQQDYDEIYLSGASETLLQMQAVLASRRIVVVGFGLQDPDVMQLLRRVGKFTHADRPIFAFVTKAGELNSELGRRVFLKSHNVDAIPYSLQDGSHRPLGDLLQLYRDFTLARHIQYRGEGSSPPAYDPETTGLLIYNALVLERGSRLDADLLPCLVGSRVLAILLRAASTVSALVADLQDLAQKIGLRATGRSTNSEAVRRIEEVLTGLVADGLVAIDGDTVAITLVGADRYAAQKGHASLLTEQFQASIASRVATSGDVTGEAATATAHVLVDFWRDSIKRRALGVAHAVALSKPAQQDYHMLALLQELPSYLERLSDPAQGLAALDCIQAVLRAPSDVEQRYIGFYLQAQFGFHLLGYDEDTLNVRRRAIADTAFVLDSSTLIPLLARGSVGHTAAVKLVELMLDAGAKLFTTHLFVNEVREHAAWAQTRFQEEGRIQSVGLFEAATGRAGVKSNAFLEGFLAEYAHFGRLEQLNDWLVDIGLVPSVGTRCRDRHVEAALRNWGIEPIHALALADFDAADARLRDEYQAELLVKRQAQETYTRASQVETEADALVLVEGLRRRTLGQADARLQGLQDAYIISNTRIIDDVSRYESSVVLRPPAALQYLLTFTGLSPDEAGALTAGLLWEMQERRADLVDTSRLISVFGPLINASTAARDAEIERYRSLVSKNLAGWSPEGLVTIPALDLPVAVESYFTQRAAALVELEQTAVGKSQTAAVSAALSDADRAELERYRAKEKKRARYDRRETRKRGK
jgi:hypothetical protein